MRINTNIPSLQAQNSLQRTTKALQRSLERLSSGKRINSAKDDASGLAVSEGLEAQTRGLRAAAMNLNQAFGYLQTADGVLASQSELIQRMKELALQASNGTLGASDRTALNGELQTLLAEFNRLTDTTEFNGTKLLNGSLDTISLQAGVSKGQTIEFKLPSTDAAGIFTNVATAGTGQFTVAQTFSVTDNDGGSGLYNMTDWNGDGRADIVDIDAYDNATLTVAIKKSDGTYGPTHSLHLDGYTISTGLDLTGDGIMDAYANDGTDFRVYKGASDGSFTLVQTAAASNWVSPVDLNGDGVQDYYSHDYVTNVLTLFKGKSDGTFSLLQTIYASGLSVSSLRDMNNDGRIDFQFSNSNGSFQDAIQNSDGTFTLKSLTTSSAKAVSLADLNRDGYIDRYITNLSTGAVEVFMGSSSGTYTRTASFTGIAGANVWATDVQNDGIIDFQISTGVGQLVTYLGNSGGNYTFNQTVSEGSAGFTQFFDMTGDGINDLVARDFSTGLTHLWQGASNGTFSLIQTLNLGANFNLLGNPADYNGDGINDISFINNGTGVIQTYLGHGSGGFTGVQTISALASSNFNSTALDLNGDGIKDLTMQSNSSIQVYLRSATGALNLAFNGTGYSSPSFWINQDLDGDGWSDLMIHSGSTDYFLNKNSSGTFSVTQTISSGYLNDTRDFNGDGKKDLLYTDNAGNYSIYSNNGGGTFSLQSQVRGMGNTLISTEDSNGDGIADLQTFDSINQIFYTALQTTNATETAASLSLSSQSDAQDALKVLDRALEKINSRRAGIGATQNRLDSALNANLMTSENLAQARSQILDADIAQESSELIKNQILQQAAIAVLGQANSTLQMVLALLKPLS